MLVGLHIEKMDSAGSFEDVARQLTYRSRGRSIIEVVLVSISILEFTSSSVAMLCFLSCLFLCHSSRPLVSWFSLWGSLLSYVSAIISALNGHKNDSVNGDWRN